MSPKGLKPVICLFSDIMEETLLGLFGLMILQVIVPQIPAELIVLGAAKTYGVLLTTLVTGSGLVVGSLLAYGIGRYFGTWKLFNAESVKKILIGLRRYENSFLLMRILPYNPSDVISYGAGIAQVSPLKIVLFTFATSYIRCYLLAVLGASVVSLTSLSYSLVALGISAILAHIVVFYLSAQNSKAKV